MASADNGVGLRRERDATSDGNGGGEGGGGVEVKRRKAVYQRRTFARIVCLYIRGIAVCMRERCVYIHSALCIRRNCVPVHYNKASRTDFRRPLTWLRIKIKFDFDENAIRAEFNCNGCDSTRKRLPP